MNRDQIRTVVNILEHVEPVYHKGPHFLRADQTDNYYSFNALVKEARRRGRHLQSLGLEKGDRLAMIIPDSEDFVLTFLGAITVGVVPVPMYPPLALGKLDGYMDTAQRIVTASAAKVLITSKQVAPILWSLTSKVETLDDLVVVDRLHAECNYKGHDVEITPDDTCFLQFTSGSTSDPKGVVVTHGNLVANARAIMVDGLDSEDRDDVGLSWLPLYHDMGLIGFVISPLLTQVPIVFIPTLSFIKRPTIWMDTISKYKASITFAPNFAFALAAKHAKRQMKKEGFDLSSLRVVGCGAEPINARTMNGFIEAFKPAGLNENAIMPCYGMAEATLAMSFDTLQAPYTATSIDRDRYEDDHVAVPYEGDDEDQRMDIVSCGRTFSNHEVSVMNEHGAFLKDGEVGELVFKGPSVTAGYFQNEDATKDAFKDGWLHTGDLGFVLDGEVYVSGRKKDLIILNGRNYYPQAIEWPMEAIAGIRKGNVVAFSVPGETSEELVVVAETRANTDASQDELEQSIRHRLKNDFGLIAKDIKLVGAGSLPKTSSGKLQRRKTRREYMDGTLGTGNRTLGSRGTRVVVARHVTSSVFARIRHRVKKISRVGRRPQARKPLTPRA